MSLAGIERWRPENWIGKEAEFEKAIMADIYRTRAKIGIVQVLGVAALIAGITIWTIK